MAQSLEDFQKKLEKRLIKSSIPKDSQKPIKEFIASICIEIDNHIKSYRADVSSVQYPLV